MLEREDQGMSKEMVMDADEVRQALLECTGCLLPLLHRPVLGAVRKTKAAISDAFFLTPLVRSEGLH